MWPVETTAANKITTGMFRCWKNAKELSWAQAQQKSIFQIMDAPGVGTPATRDDDVRNGEIGIGKQEVRGPARVWRYADKGRQAFLLY